MVRLNYTVGDNNIHISDSYLESKQCFAAHIDKIKRLYPSNAVCVNRSTESLSREWATHNALYALGIFRSHTKDVDLEYPQRPVMSALYWVVGWLVWPFIK